MIVYMDAHVENVCKYWKFGAADRQASNVVVGRVFPGITPMSQKQEKFIVLSSFKYF